MQAQPGYGAMTESDHAHHSHAHTTSPKDAAAPKGGVIDPVCGMTVDPSAGKPQHAYNGTTYHFCCNGCRTKFAADPEKYLAKAQSASGHAAAAATDSAIDPVCGMKVNIEKAGAAGRLTPFGGKNYYFCNDGCKRLFDQEPAKYLEKLKQDNRPAQGSHPAKTTAVDLVCGMDVDIEEAKTEKLFTEYQKEIYYFCGEGCKEGFDKNPADYVKTPIKK